MRGREKGGDNRVERWGKRPSITSHLIKRKEGLEDIRFQGCRFTNWEKALGEKGGKVGIHNFQGQGIRGSGSL